MHIWILLIEEMLQVSFLSQVQYLNMILQNIAYLIRDLFII